jgi:HSP20 family protein
MNQPTTAAPTPGEFRPDTVSEDVAALRAEMSAADAPMGFGGVDVESDPAGWTVVVQLPGVAAEELSIDVERRELCIQTVTEEGAGGFTYKLALPAEVDTEGVDATMDHGLLTVRLPRAEGRGNTLAEESERSRPVGAVGVDELPPLSDEPSPADLSASDRPAPEA